MSDSDKQIRRPSSRTDIDLFLKTAGELEPQGKPKGRLIFSLDATASRQPTWDLACALQAEMFDAAAASGQLHIQLCFYRGFRECRSSGWLSHADELRRLMNKVSCAGGQTQIERVLTHALAEHKLVKVNALAFVGDCMEEDPDTLCELAGQMGLRGVPAFMFQEGYDSRAADTFQEIARLSGGAYSRFDQHSAGELKALLSGVAAYAAGGAEALFKLGRSSAALAHLTRQLEHK
jgi:hypothetical protein